MDLPGRYGTIALLRPGDSTTVQSFGVDTDSVTFGRDPTCSIRLYYTAVAPLHARVAFNDDKKAYIEVFGATGVVVDGCQVLPNDEDSVKPSSEPLLNGSEFVINNKKFRFSYPPKESRAALWQSPAPNRKLRLSMIASAQVFSPRPSNDPRENLRILQSPLRAPFTLPARGRSTSRSPSPTKGRRSPSKSPTKSGPSFNPFAPAQSRDSEQDADQDMDTIDEADEYDDMEMDHPTLTLVHGSCPKVVEEARDLVILEDVGPYLSPTGDTNSGSSSSGSASSSSSTSQPRTPKRPTATLHRAVLIRSAHRAVWNAGTSNLGSNGSSAVGPPTSPTKSKSPTKSNAGTNTGLAQTSPIKANPAPLPRPVFGAPISPEKPTANDSGRLYPTLPPPTSPTKVLPQPAATPRRTPVSPTKQYTPRVPVGVAGPSAVASSSGVDPDPDSDSEDTSEEEVRDLGLSVISVSSGSSSSEGEDDVMEDYQEEVHDEPRVPAKKLGWRKSFEKLVGGFFGVKEEEQEEVLPEPAEPTESTGHDRDEQAGEERSKQEDHDEQEIEQPVLPMTTLTPKRKTVLQNTTTPARLPVASLEGEVPHPAAKTPAGFGRKSMGATAMDVDSEGFQPVYPDLAALTTETSVKTSVAPPPAVAARTLPPFMTPQPSRVASSNPRFSLGGVAQRIPVSQSPWKVKDLVLDSPSKPDAERKTTTSSVSDAERKAISERRRSALTAPDPFWGVGGVPGMSRMSSPRKGSTSPRKVSPSGLPMLDEHDADNELAGDRRDSRQILRELKEKVEVMKHRRDSVIAGTPIKVRERVAAELTRAKQEEGQIQMEVDDADGEQQAVEAQNPLALPKLVLDENPSPMNEDENPILPAAQQSPFDLTSNPIADLHADETREENSDQLVAPEPHDARSRTPIAEETPAPARTTRRTRQPTAEPVAEVVRETVAEKRPTRSRAVTAEAAEPETEVVPEKPRRARSRAPTSEAPPQAVTPAPESKVRRARSRAPTSESAVLEEEESAPKTRRGRSRALAEEDDKPMPLPEVPVAPAKPRRGRSRSATAEPEEIDDKEVATVARKPRKPPSVQSSAAAAEPVSEPALPVKRARAVKAPASVPSKAVQDNDGEIEIVAVVKGRKGRVAAKVKHEDEDEPVMPAKKPASTSSIPRPRSTRKTAAATPDTKEKEKENARSGRKTIKEEVVESEMPVKRVTRARTKA
ncbi:unnamed protein product [Mycena citricolor]|uniref:FHA domain-containing protein n=1 Tax=Mycena citricolor TaxID=2018698 RepID=A0AAD2K4R6_9AGAR|nr:unnamed protein product [Mycena citricolor]